MGTGPHRRNRRRRHAYRVEHYPAAVLGKHFGNAADPLPSWNDGPAKQAIVNFVAKVTKEGSSDFVQPAERVAAFDNEAEAGVALKDFRAMNREGSIDLLDAVVLVHGTDGKVRFEETADPSGKKWAKRGAIAGGLVGLRRGLGQDPRQRIQG